MQTPALSSPGAFGRLLSGLGLGLGLLLLSAPAGALDQGEESSLTPGQAVRRADRYLLAHRTADARGVLEPVLAGAEAQVVTAMGRVLIQENKFDEAAAELARAASMAPGDPDPELHRGEALLYAGRDADAAKAFREAAKRAAAILDAEPQNARALFQQGVAQQRLKKYANAIESLEAARKLDPGNAEIVYQLGRTQAFRQSWQPAFDLLSSAIEMNDRLAYAYYYRALTADKVRRGDLLVNDLHRFLELAPNAPESERARMILQAATG